LNIRSLVRGQEIDLVHANEPHALTAAWLAGAHRRVPVLAARRVALPLSAGSISRARYHVAARVIAISNFVKTSVVADGLPADAIEVIHDGVEIPPPLSEQEHRRARARHAIPEGKVCLGNVAALLPEKGQDLLIHALASLRERFPQCVALIAGEGRERGNLQNLARRLGVGDIVQFSGFVSDVESVYAAMDVFVFPSHEEPLGSALLMAMAYGLPVVAVGRGGIPEAVEHGKTGLLIPELDPAALASEVGHLLENSVGARQMGQAARAAIERGFSSQKMAEETFHLYRRLATAPGAYRPGSRTPA
jgi:glycosyltransferase involved in cell wall biosynthesis